MTPDATTRTPYTPIVEPEASAVPVPPHAPLDTQTLINKTAVTPSVGSPGLRLAADRLTRSRALLQNALSPHPAADNASSAPTHQRPAGTPAAASSAGLASIPGLALGIEAVKFWWSRHPLHVVGTQLTHVANATLKPAAQRNPVALVAGSFLIGGLLAWARPWRLILKPVLFAGVMPQITSALISHFSSNANQNTNSAKH
jgi:hypothetical protein